MSDITRSELSPIFRRAAKTALIVGPVLTVINQWEAVSLLALPHLGKTALTFLVPFCVSFYTGYAMRKSMKCQLAACEAQKQALERAAPC